MRIVALDVQEHLRNIRLAYDDGASCPKACDVWIVGLAHPVCPGRQPESRWRAREVEALFDRYWHAGQRWKGLAGSTLAVNFMGLKVRRIVSLHDHRVELGVDVLDASDVCFEDLHGGDFPHSDPAGNLRRRQAAQLAHCWLWRSRRPRHYRARDAGHFSLRKTRTVPTMLGRFVQ